MKLAVRTLDLHQHATTLFTTEESRDGTFIDQRYELEVEVFRCSAVARHQFCFFSIQTFQQAQARHPSGRREQPLLDTRFLLRHRNNVRTAVKLPVYRLNDLQSRLAGIFLPRFLREVRGHKAALGEGRRDQIGPFEVPRF